MDEVAMFCQMAKFDFSKPITVTIFFEDDEYLCRNEIGVVEVHRQDCLNYIEENCEIKTTENSTRVLNEEFQNDIGVTEQVLPNTEINFNTIDKTQTQTANNTNSGEKIQTTNDRNSTKTDLDRTGNVESINDLNSVVNTNSTHELTRKTSINDSEIYQHLTDGDELHRVLQKDLDKVCDHLVRLMIPYYDNSFKKQKNYLSEWENKKINYFGLSYNIVVTLILPREKNKIFVKKFLDRTIAHAGTLYNWKFEPHHVEPFYNELIEWTKQRREKENSQRLQNVCKNIRTQNKINKRNKPIKLKGNKRNKNKIKTINKDKLADTITDIRNGINNISLIEQRNDNNSMSQDTRINYKGINCNNMCDGRISDQRKEINDANTINTRLTNNKINVNGMCGTKDNSNRRNGGGIVENTANKSSSIDNRINSTITGLNENNLINENRTLAARLVDPPQPLNFSHSTVAPIPSINLNSNNSTCIFSCGDSGSKIKINVSSDVLNQVKKQQDIQKIQNLVNRIQSKENHVLDPLNSELAPKQVPCKKGLRQLESVQPSPNYKNNEPMRPSRPPRAPPPPYSSSAHIILTPVPQANNYNITQAPNTSQMTKDQPQKNINAEHNNWRLGQMHNGQVARQATTTTSFVQTTCTSTTKNHNATTHRITGPCNFCGKPANKICSKCRKISYCSKICQDLHADYVARLRLMMSDK